MDCYKLLTLIDDKRLPQTLLRNLSFSDGIKKEINLKLGKLQRSTEKGLTILCLGEKRMVYSVSLL